MAHEPGTRQGQAAVPHCPGPIGSFRSKAAACLMAPSGDVDGPMSPTILEGILTPDGTIDTRQALVARSFLNPALEKLYVERTFPAGRAKVKTLLLAVLFFEVIRAGSNAVCQCGLQWDLAIHTVPTACILGMMTFTHSRMCKPSTLGPALGVSALVLLVGSMLPRALQAGEPQPNSLAFAGLQGNLTGMDLRHEMQLYRGHVISYVAIQFVAAVTVALIGGAAGLSPPFNIAICATCLGAHVLLSYPAFRSSYGDDLAVQATWWHPTITSLGVGATQAYIMVSLKRRLFLVQLLTAIHKIEQLTREKECLEWQRRFAQVRALHPEKPRSDVASAPPDLEAATPRAADLAATLRGGVHGIPVDGETSSTVPPSCIVSLPPGPPSTSAGSHGVEDAPALGLALDCEAVAIVIDGPFTRSAASAASDSMPESMPTRFFAAERVSLPHLLGDLFGEDAVAALYDRGADKCADGGGAPREPVQDEATALRCAPPELQLVTRNRSEDGSERGRRVGSDSEPTLRDSAEGNSSESSEVGLSKSQESMSDPQSNESLSDDPLSDGDEVVGESSSKRTAAATPAQAATTGASEAAGKRPRQNAPGAQRTANHVKRVRCERLEIPREPESLLMMTWLQLERLNASGKLKKKVPHFLPKVADQKRSRRPKEDVVADVVAAWPVGKPTIVLEPDE
eukprot:Transcript_15050.p1 GENE.Transcript_15050~~Transcript_15050.p1  ORF type:complete len:684 (+),score=78.75 Transcript_15050:1188-3239(+)